MTMQEPVLPLRAKILYASGSFSGNIISRTVTAWLFFYYAANDDKDVDIDVERLAPLWALGLVFALTTVFDAIDDPVIGWWSDRTRSRWGRRLPFILLATPPWALTFFLLWTPPIHQESLANAAYLFAIRWLFNLLGTLSGSPLEALLPEIAPRNKDRVGVVTGQVLFGTLGSVMALIVSGPFIDFFGFAAMAALMAVLALISRYLAMAGAWNHVRRNVEPAQISPVEAFRSTFRNDQFLFFLPTFVLFNMGISLLTAALPFYVEEVIQVEEGQVGRYSSALAGIAILVVLLALPLVYRLAVRKGKDWVYSAAMLIGAIYLPFFFFMGFVPGLSQLLQAFLFVAPVGLSMAAVFTFPNAIMADIIDYDAIRTGMRREALYYGAQNLLEKLAGALYPIILSGLLYLGGTSEDPLGIRLVGPVAGLSIFLGYLAFRGYRLPDDVTEDSIANFTRNPSPATALLPWRTWDHEDTAKT